MGIHTNSFFEADSLADKQAFGDTFLRMAVPSDEQPCVRRVVPVVALDAVTEHGCLVVLASTGRC